MEEKAIYNKIYHYLFYLLSVAIFIFSIFLHNLYLVLLSALILLTSVIVLHSGHILNNLLIKKSKIIEIGNGYKLSNNLVSASKRVGKSYFAIAIAVLRPRNGFIYRNDAMKELLESVKEPFELCISLNEVDKKRIIDSLETKRRLKEITLSRLKPNSYDKINNIRRQIELIDSEIANISNGGKSFDTSIILRTTSRSDNEYESELNVGRNIELLANKFSTSLGVDYEVIKGEEIFNFI